MPGSSHALIQPHPSTGLLSVLSFYLWKVGGRVLDNWISTASGFRQKNLNQGWGDLFPVLAFYEDLDPTDLTTLPKIPNNITWLGEWKEVDGIPKSSPFVFSPFKLFLGAMGLLRRIISGQEDPVKFPKLLIRDASFPSPMAHLLPEGSKDVFFRVVLPKTDSTSQPHDGISWSGKVAVHFAATGDEGFSVRQAWYAAPLAMQHGIASVIPIQALYGKRRPKNERIVSTSYNSVAQVALMGGCTIEEGTSIVRWLTAPKPDGGLGLSHRVCVTGVSLGGSMTACVAARSQEDIASAPIMAASSPAAVFNKKQGGVMASSVDWAALVGSTPTLPPTFQAKLPPSLPLTPTTADDASELMTAILLQSASLDRLPPPRRPDCAVCVNARDDLYIPAYATRNTLRCYGPESQEVEVGGGHVTGFLVHHKTFRDAVRLALDKLEAERG